MKNNYEKLLENIVTFINNNNTDVIQVHKKDGNIEILDTEKMTLSIQKASDEINAPLTGGDLHCITQGVIKKIRESNKTVVSSYLIRQYIISTLKDMGFSNVALSYSEVTK